MTQMNFDDNTKLSREAFLAIARSHWANLQARSEQLPPDELTWDSWIYSAGRGAGKTRAAAEWICWMAIQHPSTRWAVIAPTIQTCISVCIEGESGVLSVLRRYKFRFEFLRSRGEILLENGSIISLYTAEEPERMRGPQFHGAWFDELAACRNSEIYNLSLPALRLGSRPQHVITTTPKPIPLILELLLKEKSGRIVKRGTTFDNSNNLPPSMINALNDAYSNTKWAKQELYGELLSQLDGALFAKEDIDRNRCLLASSEIYFFRIAIGIDPAVSTGEESSLHGIVIVGLTPYGHCYVLEDASMRGKPEEWAAVVNQLHKRYTRKGIYPEIVVEINNGGSMVEAVLRQVNPLLRIKSVRASEGKTTRAEPVSVLYSKNLVHHLGFFPELEEQMLFWIPGVSSKSPDRMDALVWAISELKDRESGSLNYLLACMNICKRCGSVLERVWKVCPNCHLAIDEVA
jgi:phage terminase large subunit-like protein